MRRLSTIDDGLTRSAVRWGERTGRWRRVEKGVWEERSDERTELELGRPAGTAAGGVARHHLAGVMHGLESMRLVGGWVTVEPVPRS